MSSYDVPTMYNCTWVYDIQGRIESSTLKSAVNAACQRHETMRTVFSVNEGSSELVQDILSTPCHTWTHMMLSHGAQLDNEIDAVKQQRYDLLRGHTSSFVLCTSSEQTHHLIVGYHHIILDGASWQIVVQDVAEAYRTRKPLEPSRVQYRHFVLEGEMESTEDRAFWKARFSRLPDPLPLLPFAKKATVNQWQPLRRTPWRGRCLRVF